MAWTASAQDVPKWLTKPPEREHIASGAFRAIDHPPIPMRGYRDASIDMADDEAAFPIRLPQLSGMEPGDALLVEHMGLSPPVDTFKPRDSRIGDVLIDIRRVKSVSGL